MFYELPSCVRQYSSYQERKLIKNDEHLLKIRVTSQVLLFGSDSDEETLPRSTLS